MEKDKKNLSPSTIYHILTICFSVYIYAPHLVALLSRWFCATMMDLVFSLSATEPVASGYRKRRAFLRKKRK